MYIILSIAFVILLIAWLLLRKFTYIWVNRPISAAESIIAGITAWLFIISLLMWFAGFAFTLNEFFSTHKAEDIFALILAVLITGYAIDFIVRSRSEIGLDDTRDFIKDAVQFRRSTQKWIDLHSFVQKQKNIVSDGSDSYSNNRARLKGILSREKELETQISLLREGTMLDISEMWRFNTKTCSILPLYDKIQEVRIEPMRKRLSFYIDLSELNEERLQDETNVLRFNRQIYDFLQSLNAKSWLKPYSPFFESYYLLCRAIRENNDGTAIYYPFMKIGVLISELRKLEGSYFNPHNLSKIAALSFKNGAQV